MGNLYRGFKIMSAVKCSYVYVPSVLGLPKRVVKPDFLAALIEREATRNIKSMRQPRRTARIEPSKLPTR